MVKVDVHTRQRVVIEFLTAECSSKSKQMMN
jgi:hypothetical protein